MELEDVERAVRCAEGVVIIYCGTRTPNEHGNAPEHIMWMLERIPEFMRAGRREKAMRWLGFVQGWLWSNGFQTIDQLKADNRPLEAR